MKLLHIDASILGDNSASRKLTAAIVSHLRAASPDLTVTYRDLGAHPVAHLAGGTFAVRMGAPVDPSIAQDVALSDEVMAELLAADILVIGAPMYNFTIPSQLKSWIDRILVAGKTFRYTPTGAEPLTSGKRLIAALASGSLYSGTAPAAPYDFQQPYLTAVFNFIGVTDTTFIRAEGLAHGPEAREKALANALATAAALELRQAA